MIDLLEESALWEFLAQKNVFVAHQPDTTGKTNRFARFNDEAVIEELSNLGFPRLELRDTPVGNLNDNGGEFYWDTMTRTVRVITKVAENNFAAKLQAQNDCKAALVEMIMYLRQTQYGEDPCSSTIIKFFDLHSVSWQIIESATSDGSFTGVQIRIQLKAAVNEVAVTYGTFTYP